MAGTSWLVDKSRIATKIKSASGAFDPEQVKWKSNPTRACPNCQNIIDNSDVAQDWPGLPKGVKFDPSDQDIICHLLAKVGMANSRPHPFIDEFITTLEVDDGICYTHPKHLPGVNQDGSATHFFHRAIKAYNTGTRKRRKIHGQDFGDVRWHKTGRTKPVVLDGVQKGCKKIMVLYMTMVRGGKAEKTNWVMHQYHLGTQEDEKEGEYVVSKVFYQQQQQVKSGDKDDLGIPARTLDVPESSENIKAATVPVDPVTPKSVTPDPPCTKRPHSSIDVVFVPQDPPKDCVEDASEVVCEEPKTDVLKEENQNDNEETDNNENDDAIEEPKCQSPNRDDNSEEHKILPGLSVYAQLGPEHLKKDLEECQDLSNIELDTPPDFRLSQLEFNSQDSYISWGGSKAGN
ncbi:hypothetical protein QN277_003946 [Acacia crassicarpa]|uniref:NAC domain-containing protein n=1 Tax=Acacia crassicarpa TaxID=499986 RepID=A0AAE1JWZ5_9FABA|nr:hypothetical protein QN277_003946 [Acacia crassicarpa]